uniref:Uncharacterized protein n=1 Tax=Rhizophora mucronata TaxID=61149 RepID=A0A2P2NMB8_RHIMU
MRIFHPPYTSFLQIINS